MWRAKWGCKGAGNSCETLENAVLEHKMAVATLFNALVAMNKIAK
jgi:hypothetical protein